MTDDFRNYFCRQTFQATAKERIDEQMRTTLEKLVAQVVPSCAYLDKQGFFKNTGNMAHLKFTNPVGHKVGSFFHLSMNQ